MATASSTSFTNRTIENTGRSRYSRRETLLTMLSVLLVLLLSSLDQTIVSTAMPRIVADLQGFDRYTWITTAYLLTSTVTMPIYGKLSDMFGRKPIFIFGLSVFLVGSALSGTASSMNQLIVFRAFQGIGAGALAPIAIAIVGDLFTPRERARWQGVTGAVFGLSSIIGPLVGGWLTQYASWRWIFYVNLPLGIIALLTAIFLMPELRNATRQGTVDYIGVALLIIGTIPLLLGFTWAGTLYSWLSPQIIGLLTFSVLALTAFFIYEAYLERRGGQPIIEPGLFRNSIFTVSVIATTVFGMGLFGSIFFIPLFVQGVLGTPVANSGFILTPLLLTAVVASILSGQLVSRLGRYKWIAITGMAVSLVGGLLMLRLDLHSTTTDVLIAMVVMGFGMGTGMSLYTLIVQNALPRSKLGQATAALTFFRSIGGTIALAVMGSILNSTYYPAFLKALPPGVVRALPPRLLATFKNPEILLSPAMLAQTRQAFARLGPQGLILFNQVITAVKIGLVQGIHNVFLLSVAILTIGLISLFFLKEIELKGGSTATEAAVMPVSSAPGLTIGSHA